MEIFEGCCLEKMSFQKAVQPLYLRMLLSFESDLVKINLILTGYLYADILA